MANSNNDARCRFIGNKGILLALGEDRDHGITALARHDVKEHRLSLSSDYEVTRVCGAGRRK